ncbi:phenol hydroxylase subunit [Hydrogenophaga sp.]|uniref:phenol hydroxylase subunit n=1 Tax=Hydrogenophaga sp. TaxID=1904254 RepID=UPI0035642214
MSTDQPPTSKESPSVDLRSKYVRLLERRADGLVSFEFSIGWHELAVELMLPSAAFDEFCTTNQVIWRDN